MSRNQYIAIAAAVLSVFALYFGFEYKPKKISALEKSRATNLEITSIDNMLMEARADLSLEQQKILEELRDKTLTGTKSNKIESLKSYASQWYDYGFSAISAYYAEEVAKLDSTANTWSIAGTSYIIGVKEAKNDKQKSFASSRAIRAFENAISLDPDEVRHKVNLALVYTEVPPPSEPMKGILMLRDLNTKYPDNVSILVQLARLALKTNQLERAEERLKKAISIEPENRNANCLMVELMQAKGLDSKNSTYIDKCNK